MSVAVLLNTPLVAAPSSLLLLVGVVIVLAAYWNQIAEKIALWRQKRLLAAFSVAAVLSTSFVYINDFGWCDGWWSYICMF